MTPTRFSKRRGGRALVRHRGVMNDTERAYALFLELCVRDDTLVAWDFEPERLRIGDGAYYTPDFRLVYPDGVVEFVEVKGRGRGRGGADIAHCEEAAAVRLKAAAERHWMYRFALVFPARGGGWARRVFAEV